MSWKRTVHLATAQVVAVLWLALDWIAGNDPVDDDEHADMECATQ